MTWETVEAALKPARGMARCPSHEDRIPSLSVKVDGGKILLNCFAGCPIESVLTAAGLTYSDLFSDNGHVCGNRVEEATYDYANEESNVLFQVVRYSPKGFSQRRPNGKRGWIYNTKDVRKVLYRLPAVIAETELVYIVEGEKDADRLTRMGVTATTNPMGAGKWRDEFADFLQHVAKVVVIADRDNEGRDHAAKVVESLTAAGITVELVEPAAGKDVSDHLNAHHGLEDLVPISARSYLFDPVDVDELMATDPPTEDWSVEPLLPRGKLVGIVATRGHGKSLLLLDVACKKATGEKTLSQSAGPPEHVVYLDMEMGPDDLWDRLNDLGYTRDHSRFQTLLEHLHYYQLIAIPPLDTEEGGAALEEIVERHKAALVVIDTVSRVVTGSENDAEPYRALFRWTETMLKRRRVTLARLDHLGKDTTRGSRGSSAKEDGLDVIWHMTEIVENTLQLVRTKGRQSWLPTRATIRRVEDNGTTIHTTDTELVTQSIIDLAHELDRLGVPVEAGTPTAQKSLKLAGKGRRRADVVKAVRFRKNQEPQSGTPREHPSGTHSGTPENTYSGTQPALGESVGNTYGNTPEQSEGVFPSPKEGTPLDLDYEEDDFAYLVDDYEPDLDDLVLEEAIE